MYVYIYIYIYIYHCKNELIDLTNPGKAMHFLTKQRNTKTPITDT